MIFSRLDFLDRLASRYIALFNTIALVKYRKLARHQLCPLLVVRQWQGCNDGNAIIEGGDLAKIHFNVCIQEPRFSEWCAPFNVCQACCAMCVQPLAVAQDEIQSAVIRKPRRPRGNFGRECGRMRWSGCES